MLGGCMVLHHAASKLVNTCAFTASKTHGTAVPCYLVRHDFKSRVCSIFRMFLHVWQPIEINGLSQMCHIETCALGHTVYGVNQPWRWFVFLFYLAIFFHCYLEICFKFWWSPAFYLSSQTQHMKMEPSHVSFRLPVAAAGNFGPGFGCFSRCLYPYITCL